MSNRIGAYTPETARAIAEFVRGARRQSPRPRIDWHEVGVPQDRAIRWARTTTSYEYPTYPTSGGVYVVEMGDYAPDTLVPGDTPSKTFTPYDPEWMEIAVDPTGATIAEDTVVRVELHDGQWWIRPSSSTVADDTILLTTPHWLTAGSASTLVPLDVAHLYFDGMIGDSSAIGINVLCDSTSVFNDPIAELTLDGFYIIDFTMTCTVSYSGSFTSITYTTGPASAGTAHTHDITIKTPAAIWSRVAFTQRTGGVGAWSVSTSAWTTCCWRTPEWYDGGYVGRVYVMARHYINASAGEQIGPMRFDVDGTADGAVYCPLTLDTPQGIMTIRRVGALASTTNL